MADGQSTAAGSPPTDEALLAHLRSHGQAPTVADGSRARSALDLVEDMVLPEQGRVKVEDAAVPYSRSVTNGLSIVFVPIGAYGLGLWHPAEEILIFIAGTATEKTFFELMKSKLRKQQGKVRILRSGRTARSMFELEILDLKVSLQYHQSPWVSTWSEQLIDSNMQGAMSQSASEKLEAWRVTVRQARQLAKQQYCQAFYYSVRWWALQHGVYHGLSSCLDEQSLIPLVVLACERCERGEHPPPYFGSSMNRVAEADEPASVLRTLLSSFFHACLHEFGPRSADSLKRVGYPIDKAAAIIGDEVTHTLSSIDKRESICNMIFESSYNTFFLKFRRYIRVEVVCSSSATGRAKLLYCVELILAAGIPNTLGASWGRVMVRLWPRPFIQAEAATEENLYEACYVIGCSYSEDGLEEVEQSISDMTQSIHAHEFYDPRFCLVRWMTVNPSELGDLVPDTGNLNLHLVAKDQRPKDGEESDEDEATPLTTRNKPKAGSAAPPAPSSAAKKPLRPALDVLHRIQHDPALDIEHYVVGYHDRHAGMREMPVRWWQAKDETEEDFIPQSRIWYFKRAVDDVKVWDREAMVDLLFGSGNTAAQG